MTHHRDRVNVSMTGRPDRDVAYGRAHRTLRRLLLADLHRTGPRPCPRCGVPMGPWNPEALDLGHVVDVADGGADGPRALEHARCNRSAGALAGHARRRLEPVQLALWEDEP